MSDLESFNLSEESDLEDSPPPPPPPPMVPLTPKRATMAARMSAMREERQSTETQTRASPRKSVRSQAQRAEKKTVPHASPRSLTKSAQKDAAEKPAVVKRKPGRPRKKTTEAAAEEQSPKKPRARASRKKPTPPENNSPQVISVSDSPSPEPEPSSPPKPSQSEVQTQSLPVVPPSEDAQPTAADPPRKLHGAAKAAYERKKAAGDAGMKGMTTPRSSKKRAPSDAVDLTTDGAPKRKKSKTRAAAPKAVSENAEDDDLDQPLAMRAVAASPEPNVEATPSRLKQKARSTGSKTTAAKKSSTNSGRITKGSKSKTRASDKEGESKTKADKVSHAESEEAAEDEQADAATPATVASKGSEAVAPAKTPKSSTRSRSASKKKVRTIVGPAGAQKLQPLERPSETLNENEGAAEAMEEDVRSDDQMGTVSKRKKSRKRVLQSPGPGIEKVGIRSASSLGDVSQRKGVVESYDEDLLGLLDRMQRQALSFLRVQDNLIERFSTKIVPDSVNFLETNAEGEGAFSKAEEDAVQKERLKQRIDAAKIQLRREIETSLRIFALRVKTEENVGAPTLLRDVDGKQELEEAVIARRNSIGPVISEDVRPFAGITNVRRFVGFAYNSLDVDDRAKCILKLCAVPGGRTYEYLNTTSGIGMKTIHAKASELLDEGYLSEGVKMVGNMRRKCLITTVSDK